MQEATTREPKAVCDPRRAQLDAQLMDKAKSDPEAFCELYEVYYPKMLNFCMRALMSVSDAEDVTSDTFLKAVRALASFKPEKGTFSGWLYRIATNSLRDHFRANSRQRPFDGNDSGYETFPAQGRLAAETASGTPEKFEEFRRLHEAISELKPVYRISIILHYFEGKPLAEIAAATNCKVVTARWRLHHARRLLARRLELD